VALLAAAQEMSDQKPIEALKGQSMIVPPTHAFEFVEPSA
jgi:hypothetical protein